ncbi:MAG: molybdopterin-synthase adenylyltransferase MoeB [Roseivirga sp.]|nr:molybdopterin-synthase adenylyltransferase MoeB [Roseivirga sp.]
MTLSRDELIRYNRQIILPDFGVAGQERLKAASVLIIGAGGLGAPNLQYLTAAGVGRIGVIDFDQVSLTNLQRQVLFNTDELGVNKATAAASKLKALNPETEFEVFETQISSENAMAIIVDYDLVVDGSDNLPTRYLVNDACLFLEKPLIYGAIFRFEGQVSVFNQELEHGSRGPNYRDLFPTPPPPEMVPSCSEGGVFGVLPGIVGSMQANEAIKVITGMGTTLSGKLLLFDSLDFTSRYLNIRSNENNPVTGSNPTITKLIDYEAFCAGPVIEEEVLASLSVHDLHADNSRYFILDVREPYEYDISNLGGLNIPLGQLKEQLEQIPGDKQVVVHCKSGVRSAQAINLLKQEGYTNLLNLEGGILAWQKEIDSEMAVY